MKHVYKFEIDDKDLTAAEKGLLLAFREVLTKPESRFLVRHIILMGSYIVGLFISKMPLEALIADVQAFVLLRLSKMIVEAGFIMGHFQEKQTDDHKS